LGETRVDLLHLLEDLRDAYPGALEETILTEIVANALDSGATRIALSGDATGPSFTVVDDGGGMARRELRRYHDLAATTKVRGEGIGFAGVGIKLGLLACDEVLTETRRGRTHVATSWHLASRQRAPWRWIPPPGMVDGHGTAVRLALRNPLSPLLDPGFIARCLERQFQPLLDPTFDETLAAHYPAGVRFVVAGEPLARGTPPGERAPIAVRLGRKRKPAAVGYLIRVEAPVGEEERGLAVSTLGKVIKGGWDWLGLNPAAPDRVVGVVEVPGLAACLTLNKADFVRTGSRGAAYLAYRKAIQEAVAGQLAAWGDAPDRSADARRRARPVERDLQRILVDLADEFPLLAALVERQAGGQARLPTARPGGQLDLAAASPAAGPRPAPAREEGQAPIPPSSPAVTPGEPAPPPERSLETVAAPGARGPSRPGRYGLAIQFESRPDDPAPSRLVESTVWVNDAHPACRRAVAARSDGYHVALCVALALAPLAVEPARSQGFITAFLEHWGRAVDRPAGGRSRARSRRRT
jgi:hypothetical protein